MGFFSQLPSGSFTCKEYLNRISRIQYIIVIDKTISSQGLCSSSSGAFDCITQSFSADGVCPVVSEIDIDVHIYVFWGFQGLLTSGKAVIDTAAYNYIHSDRRFCPYHPPLIRLCWIVSAQFDQYWQMYCFQQLYHSRTSGSLRLRVVQARHHNFFLKSNKSRRVT